MDFIKLCLVSIHFVNPKSTGLYQKTKRAHNGRVMDKTDKTDSNRRRTIDISLAQSVTNFEHQTSTDTERIRQILNI